MSYILDALRKADAERERGRVPGIHAQQLASEPTDADSRTRSTPWLVIGLSAALAAALAWNLLGRDAAPTDRHAAPAATAQPAATPETAAAALSIAAPTPAPAAAMPPATESPPPRSRGIRRSARRTHRRPGCGTTGQASGGGPPGIRRPRQRSSHRMRPRQRSPHRSWPPPRRQSRSRRREDRTRTETKAGAAIATDTETKAVAKAPATEKRVHALNELPAEIRQQLPALSVAGASYSANPSSRMLIINGQVFHEHDRLAPELTLEQIKLKAAVLEFKGYRYEIKY